MSNPTAVWDRAIEVRQGAVLQRPGGVPLQYSRYIREQPSPELIELQPSGAPILFCVTFPARANTSNMWRDGKHLLRPPTAAGSFSFFDFQQNWISQEANKIDSFHVWLPREAFRDLEQEHRTSITENLKFNPSSDCRDEIMLHLAASLMPTLSAPHQTSRLFADHVFEAMRLHIAQTYGGLPLQSSDRRGTLTPSQTRRVTDKLLSNLANDPGLQDLASLCGLSVSHFARSFKEATGLPPHRWLLSQRIKRAKALLVETDTSISEVALVCGFADQSHLTRVFSKAMGISPGAWRRRLVH